MGIIEMKDVTFSYNKSTQTQGAPMQALDGVSLSVDEGECIAIIGHSGCGKTTLLRLLAGLESPDSGSVLIGGDPVGSTDRAYCSMVFQNYTLFDWMTASGNVEFAVRQMNRKMGWGLSKGEISERAIDYLRKVEMGEHANDYPFQLSGGMQQRAAIARALSMETPILLFDEPFGALDVKIRRNLQSLIDNICNDRRKTVVFVTHDIDEAIFLANRIVFMRPGRIVHEMTIGAERPRNHEAMFESIDYRRAKDRLTELFYLHGKAPEEGHGDDR